MHTTLGAIHSTAFCPVPIVQKFGRKACKHRPFGCLEHKRGYRGAILPKVYYQMFTRLQRHRLSGLKLSLNDHLSELVFTLIRYTFPHIGSDG